MSKFQFTTNSYIIMKGIESLQHRLSCEYREDTDIANNYRSDCAQNKALPLRLCSELQVQNYTY